MIVEVLLKITVGSEHAEWRGAVPECGHGLHALTADVVVIDVEGPQTTFQRESAHRHFLGDLRVTA